MRLVLRRPRATGARPGSPVADVPGAKGGRSPRSPLEKRKLLRVCIVDRDDPKPAAEQKKTADLVERLMGRKPELRFAFIQENAKFVETDELDV